MLEVGLIWVDWMFTDSCFQTNQECILIIQRCLCMLCRAANTHSCLLAGEQNTLPFRRQLRLVYSGCEIILNMQPLSDRGRFLSQRSRRSSKAASDLEKTHLHCGMMRKTKFTFKKVERYSKHGLELIYVLDRYVCVTF